MTDMQYFLHCYYKITVPKLKFYNKDHKNFAF